MQDKQSIEVGATYKHDQGLTYRVDDVSIHDATGYENGTELKEYVLYTQLEAGSYPVGKKWVREKEDFLNHFTKNVL